MYGDSDVDIVIRLDSAVYPDLHFLNAEEKARYEADKSPATYSLGEFKAAVVGWLVRKYGSDVKVGSKAVFIKGSGARRDADVLVCAKLRRYYSYPLFGEPRYTDGICFFLPNGTRIENYPERHYENCIKKNQETRQWFKHSVRIFKRLRNTMMEKRILHDGLVPSYFIEGLLYNVPATKFGGSEQLNFKDVLGWLLQADRSKFECANGQFYLLGNTHITWPAANCTAFLNAVKKYDTDA